MKLLLAAISILVWASPTYAKSTPAERSAKAETAVRAYLDGDYAEAEKGLLELNAEVGPNGERLYNLALIRYRRGHVPQACADFLQAQWYIPGDDDLAGNLKLCEKEIAAPTQPPVQRAVDFVATSQRWMPLHDRLWLVASLWCVAWLAFFIRRQWPARRMAGTFGVVAIALFLWSGVSLASELWLRPAFVITGTQLMSGQLQDAMELRSITAGQRVTVLNHDGAWTLIELEGTRGWVRSDTLAPYGAITAL